MNFSSSVRRLSNGAVFLFLLGCFQAAGAKTYVLDAENFQGDVPDTWKVTLHDGSAIFTAKQPSPKTSLIVVGRLPIDRNVGLHEQMFYETFEKNMVDHGLQILGHRYVMSNGYQFFEVNAILRHPNGAIEMESRRAVVADGYLYDVTLNAMSFDPTTDPALSAARNSFHFLRPVALPADKSLLFLFFSSPPVSEQFDGTPAFPTNLICCVFTMVVIAAFLSPIFLMGWGGMIIHYFLTRSRPVPATCATAMPSSSPAPENRSPSPIRRDLPLRGKGNLLPPPRKLSNPSDPK